MGVTIHFEGKLKVAADLAEVRRTAVQFAQHNKWIYRNIIEMERSLARVRDEEDWNYVGLTSGVELEPHADCEPLRLEFDAEGYIQEYVKTQFAPPETHISIVELLRLLKSRFVSLNVEDEGEYWETGDRDLLELHFARVFKVMNEEISRNPRLVGPYRLDNGRIADLLEAD